MSYPEIDPAATRRRVDEHVSLRGASLLGRLREDSTRAGTLRRGNSRSFWWMRCA